MNNYVFITGGTGYIGKRIIPELLQQGIKVRALAREKSLSKLPEGCEVVIGDALDHSSFQDHIAPCKTFIQLVGVPKPSPAKKELFKKIDGVSIRESVEAAKATGIEHFIYISVAQGSKVMKEYQQVRADGEELIRQSGMKATIIQPWYVIGPGHYWPLLLLPVYKVVEFVPATKEMAKKLGLVYLNQIIATLVHAVQHPAENIRYIAVPEIKTQELKSQ